MQLINQSNFSLKSKTKFHIHHNYHQESCIVNPFKPPETKTIH